MTKREQERKSSESPEMMASASKRVVRVRRGPDSRIVSEFRDGAVTKARAYPE